MKKDKIKKGRKKIAIGTLGLFINSGLKACFYTLKHSVTGKVMLASTLPGSSAAGTVGIIAGTGKGIGFAAAGLMSLPFTLISIGIAGYGLYECLTENSDSDEEIEPPTDEPNT